MDEALVRLWKDPEELASTVTRSSYSQHSIYWFLTHSYSQGTSGINYLKNRYKLFSLLGTRRVFRSKFGKYERLNIG